MRTQQEVAQRIKELYKLAQNQEVQTDAGNAKFEEYSLAIQVLEWVLLDVDWIH